MLLRRKGQSTAEYAITIGVVVAVVAGIMQVALKGGMRKKSAQTVNFIGKAGTGTPTDVDKALFSSGPVLDSSAQDFDTYESEARQTTVDSSGYVDRKLQLKGGATRSAQQQTTSSTSVNVETFDPTHKAQ